ncbi:hypothetical protein ES332_A02G212700v1 [Gossypium tomentosum]|uniref:Uncharacterized protein n=1 Tax=Gossypium tomentosum TaxID=34277 RepID=A0A5D2RKZ2_GOSTO|nr:hypothetical protein ES332_A02G212700v1 [Gossypium tomentosum]
MSRSGRTQPRVEAVLYLYLKVLFILKIITNVVLIFWFWRSTVASISQKFVQPIGKVYPGRHGIL